MKAKQAVVCPKCGARNRPTWEFCARCNESLEGARAGEATASSEPGDGVARPSSFPASGIAVAALVVFGALGVAAWRYASQAPVPERTDPNLFRIATPAADLPTAPPSTGTGRVRLRGRPAAAQREGDLAGGLARLGAAVAASPENAEYQNVYAHALWRSGDREGSLAAHAEAARLEPRLQAQYARALDMAGRGAEAARQYEEILARSPDATIVHEDLGRLLFRGGDYAKAASHLQQAVQARPDDPVLAQELAYSLDRAGNRAQAVAVYQKVLKAAPQAVVARGLLAESLVEDGKKDEALAVLQEGLKATPSAPLLQRQVGSVLERSGRPAEAAAAYRAYARLAPNAPDARDIAARAARLEAAGGNP